MLSRRVWAVALVAMASLAAYSLPVSAANFQPQTHFDSLYPTLNTGWPCVNGVGGTPAIPTNGFCRTDSRITSWYADANDGSLGDIDNPASIVSINEDVYEPTVLTMSRTFNPKFSGTGETDIFYQGDNVSGHMPPNAVGVAWCNDALEGTNECDQHYVRFNTHLPFPYLICHETGHALGLTHGFNAADASGQHLEEDDFQLYCMRTEGDRSASSAVIGPALTTQLNAHYQNQ